MANELLQPVRSGRSRKTPQPELPPQRSSRRTPKLEKIQPHRPPRKTPTIGATKRRGRPAKSAISDELDDISTSRAEQAVEDTHTKKKEPSKVRKERRGATASRASEIQDDRLGTTGATPSAAPSTGVKKRRKRKSIGQQSTSRAKAAKARSPLKSARQPRKRILKPDVIGSLAKPVRNGPLVNAVPLDGGEPVCLPEIAETLDCGVENVEANAEELQRQDNAQQPKKRNRTPVEELPEKRVKANSNRNPRASKALKTQKEALPAKETHAAVQSVEKPAVVEAGSLGDADQGQDAVLEIGELRQEKPKKRKRIALGQKPKKRAKLSITQISRQSKAQEETKPAEDVFEATPSSAKPAEADVGSIDHLTEKQEIIADAQTQKPKRKKRKSIGQQKPKKVSVDHAKAKRIAKTTAASNLSATGDELNKKPAPRRGRPRAKQALDEAIEETQAESAEHKPEEGRIESSRTGLKSKPKAIRGRPKAKPNSVDAAGEPDDEVPRHAPEGEQVQAPVLPIKKKRGRPRKSDAAQSAPQTTRPTKAAVPRNPRVEPASTAPKARAPPKNSIPITIYAPPSSNCSNAEDDPLNPSQSHTTTNKINAVDVLSQLCSEKLSKSSSNLDEQIHSDPSQTKRSELKRTKRTTDLYAEELASRLLQLTTTLNTNTSLQSRVRAAAKEERNLKKEMKQLEKEREDLKVRKEEVITERRKKELEDLLSGIAGAVKRGWDMQKESEGEDAVAGRVEGGNSEV